MRPPSIGLSLVASLLLLGTAPIGARADEGGWIELSASPDFEAWQNPKAGRGQWAVVGGAHLSPENPRRLVGEPGEGVILNGPTGKEPNLVSKAAFGDVEFQCEFMVPKGSNSGVKFQEVYEIQIFDSYGASKLDGSASGGIYPRSERKPKYHHIDDGFAPKVNAAKPPGEWQTLHIIFRAPRVDAAGKQTENAQFVKVVLNGQVVQEAMEIGTPTGNNWRLPPKSTGRILIQGDHGPVAFRNMRARPWTGSVASH